MKYLVENKSYPQTIWSQNLVENARTKRAICQCKRLFSYARLSLEDFSSLGIKVKVIRTVLCFICAFKVENRPIYRDIRSNQRQIAIKDFLQICFAVQSPSTQHVKGIPPATRIVLTDQPVRAFRVPVGYCNRTVLAIPDFQPVRPSECKRKRAAFNHISCYRDRLSTTLFNLRFHLALLTCGGLSACCKSASAASRFCQPQRLRPWHTPFFL